MLLVFRLSMPGNNAWDGKWSGSSKLYARVISFQGKKRIAKAEQILAEGPFSYNFGDGWRASISVDEVGKSEAQKYRRRSDGFCGYDWMIDSIVRDLKIAVPQSQNT